MRASDLKLSDVTVYVDMDGVLADLFNHAGSIHDVDHYSNMTKDQWEEFFKTTNAYKLFRNLPVFPSANKLLQMVKDFAGGYTILSSPLSFDKAGSIKGKREWLSKHIHVPADNIIFEHDKAKYATSNGKPNILIDDYGVNIRAWQAAGGIAIKYQADEDSLQKVFKELQAASKGEVDENFADGKKPGRKGLAKRSGVNTKASVSSLRKTAKHSTGEKARMAHWLANMKAGRAKHEDVEEGWKDWVAAGTLGAAALGAGNSAYDAYKSKTPDEKPAAVSQDFKKGVDTIAKDAVPKILVTGSPHERYLTNAAVDAGIKGTELAQFLAQCAHETMDFKHMKEIGGSLDFKKYEPRFEKDKKTKKFILDPKTKKPKNFNPKATTLGNTHPGDGEKYKGRGYIQLTGKYNYERAGKALGLDLVKRPELVEKPEVAAKVAVWFWQNRVQPKVDNFNNTAAATKPINKGLHGLENRKEKFGDFKTAMR